MSIIVPQRKKGPQYVQEVAPTSPKYGDTWYDSNYEKLMIYTTDNQWVEFEKIGGNPGSLYGYSAGGQIGSNYLSTIDRITFPFDSGTAIHVGNLSTECECDNAACNSSNYGYISTNTNASGSHTTIERITFPFDSGIAFHVGDLNFGAANKASCNSSNYGYFTYGSTSTHSEIDRIIFPFDSGTASVVGNLSINNDNNATACNSSNYGYFCKGVSYDGSDWTIYLSNVERITFPFDSGTSSHVGNLSHSGWGSTSCNSSNYGYVFNAESAGSIVERLTFPFDSGTAVQIGNLSVAKLACLAFNSTNYGYCCGGSDGSSYYSTVDRITFPFDSGTATHVGNLSGSRGESAGLDGTDFCTLFVD